MNLINLLVSLYEILSKYFCVGFCPGFFEKTQWVKLGWAKS